MVKISREENTIIIKPQKKYPQGYDLEIGILPDMAVFHINKKGSGPNVQLTPQEFNKLLDLLVVIRENMPLENVIKLIDTLGGD